MSRKEEILRRIEKMKQDAFEREDQARRAWEREEQARRDKLTPEEREEENRILELGYAAWRDHGDEYLVYELPEEMQRIYSLEGDVDTLAGMLADQEPAALIGEEVATAHKSRQDHKDKKEIRGYAVAHWQKFPTDSIADVLRIPPVAPFTRYYNKQTLHRWFKDLKPGGTRRGRPKKK